MTATAAPSIPSPPTAGQRHGAALDRRRDKLARDHARGAAPEVIAEHQGRIDRLALIKAKAEERAAAKAEKAAMDAHFAAKEAIEQEEARASCVKILDRIQSRCADDRARRKLETRADRHRASVLRKNPHVDRDRAIQPGHRTITDPSTIGKFVKVRVNLRTDVLAIEHSARPQRISDVEFAVGRLLQEAWTGRSECGGNRKLDILACLGVLPEADPDDGPLPSRDMGMLRGVFHARAVAELDAKITNVVGSVGARLLRAILVEGHTIGTYAACTVGGGERGSARIGERFRWLLGEVANHLHTATGAEGQRIRATREPA